MRIAYNNYIDSASAVTALTELSGFEVSNVQDQRLGTKWASSTATAQTVTIQYASTTATSIQVLGIYGHNLTSACTVQVHANPSDSWGSPAFTTTLTVLENNIVKYLDSALQYKFWQFDFDGQASLEIGRLWQSGFIQIDPASLNNFTVTKKRSDIVVYGKHRQKFADEGEGWRAINLSFPRTLTTSLNNVLTCIDTVGIHTSFLFCNFDTIRDYEIVEPLYGSFVGDTTFTHTRGMKFEYSLLIEEDL